MKVKFVLDADRTAYAEVLGSPFLKGFVDEDHHFVAEPERRREVRPDELIEMQQRLASGDFVRIHELPPVPTLTPRPAAWGS